MTMDHSLHSHIREGKISPEEIASDISKLRAQKHSGALNRSTNVRTIAFSEFGWHNADVKAKYRNGVLYLELLPPWAAFSDSRP